MGHLPQFAIIARSKKYHAMKIILGLGANIDSLWGSPSETLHHVLHVYREYGVQVKAHSRLYRSTPLGPQGQPAFVNAVAEAETRLPPSALLKRLKALEKRAGRRLGRRWGPRPLDLDVLDYAGRIINWPPRRSVLPDTKRMARTDRSAVASLASDQRPGLVVPHPALHLREFVLRPLADILPQWHHPVTGASTLQLLTELMLLNSERQGRVLSPVDGADLLLLPARDARSETPCVAAASNPLVT